jgi:hypothetical protein
MSRFILAFSCFFRLLFGGRLHPRAADYLPDDAKPALPPAPREPAPAEPRPRDQPKPAEAAPPPPVARPEPVKVKAADQHRDGALALLALLQREGRLVDFLREPIDGFSDEEIGAAVRDIHRGCKKVLDDYLVLEAVMPGDEDDEVAVPRGFDPAEVRLIGEVAGEPPFKGVLRHHGWRAAEVRLPSLSEGVDRHVVAPAEVELA